MTAGTRRAASSAALVLLCALACRGGKPDQRATTGGTAPPPPGIPVEEAQRPEGQSEEPPLDRTSVTLFFPSATGDGLASEDREIFATPLPEDRVKQILSDLITGPATDAALPAVPPGTRLRQVYVLKDGTAYADFSTDLLAAAESGGSTDEILAVYAIVNSVAMNVPGIARVGILVEGRPCETLGGHVDLRRPLRADPSLVETPPPEEKPPGTQLPPVDAPPAPGQRTVQV